MALWFSDLKAVLSNQTGPSRSNTDNNEGAVRSGQQQQQGVQEAGLSGSTLNSSSQSAQSQSQIPRPRRGLLPPASRNHPPEQTHSSSSTQHQNRRNTVHAPQQPRAQAVTQAQVPRPQEQEVAPPIPRRDPRPTYGAPIVPLGDLSTPAFPNSLLHATNFMLGAGMLIIQPSTGKVALIYDQQDRVWFLPKGRKDVGESLETAALREAYEESGYRATLMPLPTPTQAPLSPNAPPRGLMRLLNTEPIYISTYYWDRSFRRKENGIYLTFWYVGEIPEDAVHHTGTGMPDEQHYTTYLLDYEEARTKLVATYLHVLDQGYALWIEREEFLRRDRERRRST